MAVESNRRRVPRGPSKPRKMGRQSPTGNLFPSGVNPPKRPRDTVVTQDEYIADVFGSVAFGTARIPINPGLPASFPWLSLQANQFEKYYFSKLEYYYTPTVSGFATGGSTGKVILSVDYDSLDSNPTSKKTVEDTHPHIDAMPYNKFSLPLSPSLMRDGTRGKYIRSTLFLPPNADIKTYDSGALFLSTQGMISNAQCGELRCRYVCHFLVPKLDNAVAAIPVGVHATTSFNLSEGVDTSIPWNTVVYNTVDATINANGQFLLPAGNYWVDSTFRTAVNTVDSNLVVYFGISSVVQAPYTMTSSAPVVAPVTQSWNLVSSRIFFVSDGTHDIRFTCECDFPNGPALAAFNGVISITPA